jgi:phosphotriesterase-related protein
MRELATTGCYLEFDLFGQESSFYPMAPIDIPNDATRIGYLRALSDAGFGEEEIRKICVENPARVLAIA